jgi:hypothetical protein
MRSSPFKWIFFFAVISNLILALWSWSVRPESQASLAPAGSGLGQVILLRELAADEQSRLALSLQTEQARDRALENFSEIDIGGDPLAEGGCYIYSLPTRERLELFADRMQTLVPTTYIGEQVVQQPGAIMLYIAPQPSFRFAQIELNELRAAGVDGFIIADGAMENGISVGVFNAEQNIQQRMDQLRVLGYQLERYQYMVDRSVYAVNIPALSQAAITPESWAEIRRDFPQLSSQQNSCWKVASTLNFN